MTTERSGAMRLGMAIIALGLLTSLALLAGMQPAQAWWRGGYGPGWGYGGGWRGGVFLGFPPPVYYPPPPVYYAPPYYPPPAYQAPVYAAPSAAQGCYAGPYVCPLDAPAAVGGPCSCPANNGRVFGRAN